MSKAELLQTAKPILFNTEMVQAILDGRKTQTRRVIPFKLMQNSDRDKQDNSYVYVEDRNGHWLHVTEYAPYKKGDTLYVRETFTEGWRVEDYSPNNEYWFISDTKVKNFAKQVFYKAGLDEAYCDSDNLTKWKPSIHMPKEYARILLKVTNVRVEKLTYIFESQDDSADVFKEGFGELGNQSSWQQAMIDFKKNWNSTAKDGYKWEDNPYVFVYEFELIDTRGVI